MIDGPFREVLPQLTRPLLRILERLKISPNSVTFLGLLLGLAASICIANGAFFLALLLWWIGRICDGMDGLLARKLERSSPWGAFLDINFDMLAYSSVILAFFWVWPDLSLLWMSILVFYILCITGALSLGNLGPDDQSQNRKLQLAAGLAEGGETGVYYSLVLIFPKWVFELSCIWIAVLTITVLGRFALAKKQLT